MLIMKNICNMSVEDAVGKGLGFAVHAEETAKALKRQGVSFTEDTNEANVLFTQLPSFAMKRVPGKLNVLFTACETEELPQIYIDGAKNADLIICTSKFVEGVFKSYLPNKPITTASLGVDVNLFEYRKRQATTPFLYLWVGAPDFRKGSDLVLQAWRQGGFHANLECGLIMKTTGGNPEAHGNLIIERRKFPWSEMVKLYHMAHCFVFPSYAEGFGLPLAEAMATGLPCIFTPWGGVRDFANKKNAFPLTYKIVDIDLVSGDDVIKTKGAQADMGDLIRTMKYIKTNYAQCVVRAKNARRTIEKDFTWDDTARHIKTIIERFMRNGTIDS